MKELFHRFVLTNLIRKLTESGVEGVKKWQIYPIVVGQMEY